MPLQVLVDKFSHTRFEPTGFTGNPQIPIAKSIMDYIFRWLALKFLPSEQARRSVETPVGAKAEPGAAQAGAAVTAAAGGGPPRERRYLNQADAPPCHTCGEIMVRNGACYKCSNCGATSGCS